MAKIFLSYRRHDTSDITGRIFDRLEDHYGPRSLIMDIDSIPPGVDFREYIRNEITDCCAVLTIMGKNWLRSKDDPNNILNNPDDFVRVEIEMALQQGIFIIPILVADASMPSHDELPRSLQKFAYLNAMRVDPVRDFRLHVQR